MDGGRLTMRCVRASTLDPCFSRDQLRKANTLRRAATRPRPALWTKCWRFRPASHRERRAYGPYRHPDRKRVVLGKSVSVRLYLGGRRNLNTQSILYITQTSVTL